MKYSIITISYNNKKGLEQTIKSVTSQTFHDFQYIVIDGGSSDGSLELLQNYASKIDYWVSEPDKGIYNAMNKGIKQARGEYLNFMNSGDTYHSDMVLEEIANIESKEDIISGTNYDMEKGLRSFTPPREVSLLTLLKDNLNHQATFYKRTLFQDRQYDEKYKILSDFKFNLQSIIIDNCTIKWTNIIVADYDTNGISSNNKHMVMQERKQILEELFPHKILKDYETMYTSGEIPLVELLPALKESPFIQRHTFRFAKLLLKCKHLIK